MSFATPAAAVPFSVKLHLHRKSEVEIRRFACPASFDALGTTLQHLWGGSPKNLTLEYTDDEGDRVRLSTELEWQECVRLFQRGRSDTTAAPLALHAFRSHKLSSRGAAATATEEGGVSSESDVEESASKPRSMPAGDAPRCCGRTGGSLWGSMPRFPAPVFPPLAAIASGCHMGRRAWMHSWRNVQRDAMALREHLGHAVVGVKKWTDVDAASLETLRAAAVSEGCRLIEACEHIRAERLLASAMRVFEDDATIAYNLACALARQAKLDEALGALGKSISLGYNDVAHVVRDTDFSALRGDARFEALVQLMRSAISPAAAAAPTAAVPTTAAAASTAAAPTTAAAEPPPATTEATNPTPSAPVPAVEPVRTPAPTEAGSPPAQPAATPAQAASVPAPSAVFSRLIEMFPWLTPDNANRIIIEARGDLVDAVQRIIA